MEQIMKVVVIMKTTAMRFLVHIVLGDLFLQGTLIMAVITSGLHSMSSKAVLLLLLRDTQQLKLKKQFLKRCFIVNWHGRISFAVFLY